MASKFKIPLQSEVEAYMMEKKGWPQAFCRHYAERFWNHYQASGWKLSNGNQIKDWKACFTSQWQTLKFKEDIEMLNAELRKLSSNNNIGNAPQQFYVIDELLSKYKKHPSSILFSEFGKHYDFMKSERLLIKLQPGEADKLLELYSGDKYKCRCACVQKTFDSYVNSSISVFEIFEIRKRMLNGQNT